MNGSQIRAALVSLLLVILATTARAQQDACADMDPRALQILEAMARGDSAVNFSGVVTLQRGGDMQIVEISHSVADGQEREQLTRLTGQDASVTRPAHPLNCLHPGHQLLKSGLGESGGVCTLAAHYRFRVAPGERIAGREALRLRAEPRDMYRFGHVFDLDRESALMLRSTTLGADQRVIEQYQFASLQLAPRSAETPAKIKHTAAHPHPAHDAHLRAGRPWEIEWVPEGFVTTDAAPATSQRKTYTDGLSSFSVFLEPLSRPLKAGEGVERQGSTVAYTRGMRLQQQPVLVTVVGEIPTNTARMVADSVILR